MTKRFQKFDGLIQASADVVAVVLAGFFSERLSAAMSFSDYLRTHFEMIYLVFVFIPLVHVFDLYYPLRDFRRYRAMIRLLVAILAFSLVMILIAAIKAQVGHPITHARSQLFWLTALLLLFTYLSRVVLSVLRGGLFERRAVLIGESPASRLLLESIAEHRQQRPLGFRVIGYVADRPARSEPNGLAYLGSPSEIPRVCRQHGVSLFIYALEHRGDPILDELLVRESMQGIFLISALALYQGITGRVPHHLIDTHWLIEECVRARRFTQAHMKRLLDLSAALLLGLISLPVLAVAAMLIKRDSQGPILFKQPRTGKFGRPFTMYKLRTMHEEPNDPCTASPEHWHHRQEARITRIGHMLRRTHIDEIPQLFNVIKGDMSLVGPRPEMEIFIATCEKEIPLYRLRLYAQPGLTGWAQVAFRHTSSLSAYKEKFEYELYYLSHMSLQLDLEILARTVFTILFRPSR